ncbi:MAG: hypothetical protein O2958_07995 [Gemmatimonadetes bacterium]|nr:hypothetical protein [Gemmatimonadota bacterium]MDA1104065.1 hypothetical protein [Gemmatimonadota bacterium]
MTAASAVRTLAAPGLALGVLALALAWPNGSEEGESAKFGALPPVVPSSDGSLVSSQVADRVVTLFQLFQTGNGGEQLVLEGSDLSSVLRFALPALIPRGVTEPTIELLEGGVRVRARVATVEVAGSGIVASVSGVLPDTLEVEVRGRLEGGGGQDVVLLITHLTAGRVPLPPAVVESIVASLAPAGAVVRGGDDDEGSDVLASLRLPWRHGVETIAVWGDRLVLERFDVARDRAVDGSGGK